MKDDSILGNLRGMLVDEIHGLRYNLSEVAKQILIKDDAFSPLIDYRVREAVPIILKKEGLYGRNERSYAC